MNCFYHPERSAVAQCSDCGKGLCKNCITTQHPVRCDICVKKIESSAKYAKENEEKERKKKIKVSCVLFVIGMMVPIINLAMGNEGNLSLLQTLLGMPLSGVMLAGIPYGWSFLNPKRPRGCSSGGGTLFIVSHETYMGIGFLKYLWFMFKVVAAMAIGWIFLLKEILLYRKNRNNN